MANEATLREYHASYIAGLIDGRARIYVSRDTGGGARLRLYLAIFLRKHVAEYVEEWLKDTEYSPSFRRPTSNGDIAVYFRDQRAAIVLTMAWTHLKSDLRRRQCKLAFSFFRTRRARGGASIPEAEQGVRERVMQDLEALSGEDAA